MKLLNQLYDVSVLQATKDCHFVLDGIFLTLDLSGVDHLQCKRQLPRSVHVVDNNHDDLHVLLTTRRPNIVTNR